MGDAIADTLELDHQGADAENSKINLSSCEDEGDFNFNGSPCKATIRDSTEYLNFERPYTGPSCGNLSTIPEESRANSTVSTLVQQSFRSQIPKPSSIVPSRISSTVSSRTSAQQVSDMPPPSTLSSRTSAQRIPKSNSAQPQQSLGPKEARADDTSLSSAMFMHNPSEVDIDLEQSNVSSASFSTRFLAQLDAKYKHLQAPVKRMNLDEIMSGMKLRSFRRPFSAKQTAIQAVPFKQSAACNESAMHTARSISTLVSRNTTGVSESLAEPIISKSCFLSADKGVLAFGFVDNKMPRELSAKITNNSDEPLWIQPSIVHLHQALDDQQIVFQLKNRNSFSIDPHSTYSVDVAFEPKKAITYNGQLRLRLKSKDEPEFMIQMFGYGARADLRVHNAAFEEISMGADGVGVCEIDRSAKQIDLVLINKGQRDAFAYIIAVDSSDQPLPNDVVSISPNRVVVQKKSNEFMRFTVAFRSGFGSAKLSNTARSNSQMSVGSTQTTRTLQNERLGRIQIVWGEERLRYRLKTYLTTNNNENLPPKLMDFVMPPFHKEKESSVEKLVGSWDVIRFTESLRLITVQFVDLGIRPQSSAEGTITRRSSVTSVHPGVINEQTLANTMNASRASQHFSGYTSAFINDDTIPLLNRRNQRNR